jgi:hypothetical protein
MDPNEITLARERLAKAYGEIEGDIVKVAFHDLHEEGVKLTKELMRLNSGLKSAMATVDSFTQYGELVETQKALMLNRMMRKALADLMNAPVDVPASFVVKIVPSSNTPSALHATITVEHKRVKLIKPTVDEDEIELPASTVTTKESGGGGSGGEDK